MTREDIIRMAREAEFGDFVNMVTNPLIRFANLIAAHEREACAKWAELVAREIDNTNNTASYIASGIRERGNE